MRAGLAAFDVAAQRRRSAALGAHVEQCNDCGRLRIAYNSCLMGKAGNGELAIAMTAISCALPLSRAP